MGYETEMKLKYTGETPMAYRIEDDDGKTLWLPKSQVDIESGATLGKDVNFVMPEWLAIEKGLA